MTGRLVVAVPDPRDPDTVVAYFDGVLFFIGTRDELKGHLYPDGVPRPPTNLPE